MASHVNFNLNVLYTLVVMTSILVVLTNPLWSHAQLTIDTSPVFPVSLGVNQSKDGSLKVE